MLVPWILVVKKGRGRREGWREGREREREEEKEEDRSGREGDEKGSGRERNTQNVYHQTTVNLHETPLGVESY